MFVLLLSMILGEILANPLSNVWLSPIGSLTPLRQFHMQDGSGGYHYSFTGPHHAKAESSLNGITQGGYSYIDANGILQTVTYTADDQNGFRVSASNLPQPPRNDPQMVQDTPEVAAAKKSHLEELQKSRLSSPSNHPSSILSYKILPSYYSFVHLQDDEKIAADPHVSVREVATAKNPFLLSHSEVSRIDVPKPDPSLSKIPSPSATSSSARPTYTPATSATLPKQQISLDSVGQSSNRNSVQLGKVTPLATVQRPVTVPTASYVLPILPYRFLHSSLHHAQDSLGQYDYSYTGDSSAKTESRSLDGTTRGAYSYIDPNGLLQQVHYIADHNGFRVMATNLPEAK